MATRPNGQNQFIWLIVSSLVLLGLFQVFWLRKVWGEQREALRQEADNVFQRTVLVLQDSLTRRAMRRSGLSADSVHLRLPPSLPPQMRTLRLKTPSQAPESGEIELDRPKRDSLRYESVQIFVSTLSDSTHDGMPPPGVDRLLLNWRRETQLSPSTSFFKIEEDTLDLTELREHYAAALQKAGLPGAFQLIQFGRNQYPDSTALATQLARAGVLTDRAYAAVFPDYRGFVLRKTLPYGLFALLLFGVTAAAFAAIWRSLRRQQRLTKLKNDFIANITHELKTPITTVGVALEALSDFEARHDPTRTREYLDISKLELERLSLLVDKVLRLSMFEQQEPRLHVEPLDLAEVTGQVLGALKLQAERSRANIHFTPPDKTCMVSGDRLHLASVIFNLLDNALKYARERPDIRVILEKTDAVIRLTVQDNGPGIAPEYQAKIFEKFFRVPAEADTHDVKGHGLGLSYAAEVARLHGGSIRVESVENEGSTFILELPVFEQ